VNIPSRFGMKLAASIALLAVLRSFTVPADPHIRLCGFYWLTGRPCPLCGMTRALFALAHGQWTEALHFHALSPLGLILVLSALWDFPLRSRLWTFGLAAFAVYGVLRLV
jgi:hypothetical protein